MLTLQSAAPSSFTTAELAAIATLRHAVWPNDHPDSTARLANFHRRGRERPARRVHALFEDARALAVAETFARTLLTPAGPLRVMALAGVCTDPARRGQGFGRQVVQSAFARLAAGEFSVALFQTGVPDFYLRLGARRVTNHFINRLDPNDPEKTPFWDQAILIHPATAPWPADIIDLNGPGY